MASRTLSVLALLCAAVVLLLVPTHAKENLPADAQLRIGVLSRPAECTRRTHTGQKLSMHYTGTLYTDGSKFDSSLDRSDPFSFVLGRGQVIKGWDQGLKNMCIGEKRKLIIPSDLGYGARGSGAKIPGGTAMHAVVNGDVFVGAGATLVFVVELLDILDE